MIPLSDVDALFRAVRDLRQERIKAERLSEKASRPGLTSKQAQKAAADLNWQAMHVVKLEAAVHAAAVNAGIADMRDPGHYQEQVSRPSGWHEYRWMPAKPRALSSMEARS